MLGRLMQRGRGNWRQHVKARGGRRLMANLYHRGGRGRQRSGGQGDRDEFRRSKRPRSMDGLESESELCNILRMIDGCGYKAYRELEGRGFSMMGGDLELFVDHVQSDPFAAPSKARLRVPMRSAQFPENTYMTPVDEIKEKFAVEINPKTRNIALCDFLARAFSLQCHRGGHDRAQGGGGWAGKKGGDVRVDCPSQNVLERTTVNTDGTFVEVRCTVGLPARGRTVLGRQAEQILTRALPQIAHDSLFFPRLSQEALYQHLHSVEDQEVLRGTLGKENWAAFVGDGAILPRQSGVSDLPMQAGRVPFESPATLRRTVELPHHGAVSGMAVPKGVTLIVGGGFHGKSTALNALEVGVFDKVVGDGREFVVMDPNAVKIRAEDGRNIASVDISPFIRNLPQGKDTENFSTPDASGSTSQAANIMEALEAGARTLLIDEDTCASNFMIRDRRMQTLVADEKEPITPFIAKVRALFEEKGVSSILVIGGAGDYFDVADTVIMMDAYRALDVTARAKQIAQEIPGTSVQPHAFGSVVDRMPVRGSVGRGLKTKAIKTEKLLFGHEEIDLAGVEQLVEMPQTRAIGDALLVLAERVDGKKTLRELLEELQCEFESGKGMDVLARFGVGHYARPRSLELAAAFNRLRTLKCNQDRK